MLYHLIRLWFKRQLMWFYYKDVSVNKEQVAEAVQFAKSLQILEGYWSPGDKPMEPTVEYAKYILGHYILSAAASNSRLAFRKTISSAPLLYQADETKLLTWIGAKAWSHAATVLHSDYSDGILYSVFEISGLPIVKLKYNKKTEIKIIENKEDSANLIYPILSTMLNDIQNTLRGYMKSGEVYDTRSDMKKLKAVAYVATSYKLVDIIERDNKLVQVLNEIDNKD